MPMSDDAHLQASDPSTPGSTLAALSRPRAPGVCAAVARNPNVPTEVLLQLMATSPDEALANPVLPLLLLERGGWSTLPAPALRAAARSPGCPGSLLEWV